MNTILIETFTSRLEKLKNHYKSFAEFENIGFENFQQQIKCEELIETIKILIELSKDIGKNLNKNEEILKFENENMHLPLDYNDYIEYFLTDGYLERSTNPKVKLYKELKEKFLDEFDDVNLLNF